MFSHDEKVDMLFIYGEARKNAMQARRLYALRYPERNLPDHKIFHKLEHVLRQNNKSLLVNRVRQKTVTTDENVAIILSFFQNHPESSIRKAVRELNLSYNAIQRVLKVNKFHDYKIHSVQGLRPGDFERRENFITQFLVAINDDSNLYNHILWTDESHFISHGIPNRRNTHHWSDENPHNIREVQRQGHFGVNVWCGIVGRHLIGPYFYHGVLTGQRYCDFLVNEISVLLDNLPLQIRRHMWIQLDGGRLTTTLQLFKII